MQSNGLIQSAKNSKNSAENEVAQQTEKMNSLLTEYANIMAEDSEITEPGEGCNPGGGSGTSYITNIGQSTTGNVTGIYDMSGGTWECVAGYVKSGGSYGSSLVNAPSRYKDIYSSYQESVLVECYGDAVYETSSSSSISNSSWYSDYSYFPDSNIFFIRGGNCNIGSSAGMFAFYGYYDNDYNDTYSDNTFRVVVPAL